MKSLVWSRRKGLAELESPRHDVVEVREQYVFTASPLVEIVHKGLCLAVGLSRTCRTAPIGCCSTPQSPID